MCGQCGGDVSCWAWDGAAVANGGSGPVGRALGQVRAAKGKGQAIVAFIRVRHASCLAHRR